MNFMKFLLGFIERLFLMGVMFNLVKMILHTTSFGNSENDIAFAAIAFMAVGGLKDGISYRR